MTEEFEHHKSLNL